MDDATLIQILESPLNRGTLTDRDIRRITK